jgi:sulfite exporter TauE/SafE
MNNELYILAISAASIGFLHTILGPDHYIPFIVMSKAGKWSKTKTIWVTVLSGVAHVLSSVVLGIIGVAAGIALGSLELIESTRGEIAAWLLMSFGLIYLIWGIRYAMKNKKHTHWHSHSDGVTHSHEHKHHKEHAHVHEEKNVVNLTPWILFTIFIFGPCEALIPFLMYPAAEISITGMVFITAIFGITTIVTMLSVVLISIYGIKMVPFGKFEKYSHALAGGIILFSGMAVQFLGL